MSARVQPRRPRRLATGVESLEGRELLAVMGPFSSVDSPAAELRTIGNKPGGSQQLDPALLSLAEQVTRGTSSTAALASTPLPMLSDPIGRVGVTITASNVPNVLPKLAAMGFSTSFADANLHTIEGYLPIGSLTTAATLGPDGLMGILPIYRPGSAVGSVTSQAEYVLQADRVRNTPVTGVNGSGVNVGVLSDSFNRLNGYGSDVSSGDLPDNVQILAEGPTGSSDEGRAMAQLVYDMAPGAGLGFATAFNGEGSFANNIRALANPNGFNAKVITDDVFYFEEPLFQDGVIAQAINQVATTNDVAYMALAGNLGSNAYESTNINFTSDTFYAGSFYNFNPGGTTDTRQRITVAPGQQIIINLQWDNPFYTTSGVTTDLDIYLLNGNNVVAGSARSNLQTQTPSELFGYTNTTSTAQSLDLAILLDGGPAPGRIKWVNYGANGSTLTVNEYNTNSPTVIPHSAAAGALSVAAAPYFNQLSPETYSSLGPFTALFSPNGTRLSTADIRQAPDITSVDGTDTTFFGFDADQSGRPNFFGTSAAAPHAAGVAALVRSANPGFTSTQVYNRMTSTATDISPSTSSELGVATGVDNRTGSGLINAFRATYGPPVAASTPIRDGFETKALSTNWDTYATGGARTLVTDRDSSPTEAYRLTLDSSIGGQSGLNEATLLVNTAGVSSDVLLSFREREFNESDSPMPATFTGHSNSDGVAFSVDGTTWYRLISLTGTNSTNGYRTFNYNLTQAAAALGLTLGSTTRVRFQRFGSGTIFGPTNGTAPATPTGGIAFDDIRVALPSTVSSTVVDDGGAQRSVVRQIVLNLNGVITQAPPGAFTISRTQDNAGFVPTVSLTNPTATTTRITLTFTGSGTEFGSLPDGDYTVVVNGSQLIDDLGAAADVDGDGRVGGTRTLSFFRLFGDTDGDRDVDATDFNVFRQAYLGQIPLVTYLDFNNNGTIVNDTTDRDAFLARRGKRLTATGVTY